MKTYFSKSVITFSVGVILSLISLLSVTASAQEDAAKFPSRPITFISPLPPGASADLSLRLIAKEAEKFLGQPVVVLNKTGGTHAVGAAAIASAKPDGYTIGYTSTTPLVITPFLEKLPYDPLKDFQQIMQFGEVNFGVVVKGDSPFKTFKDIIEYGRQNPKKVTFGTGGATSIGRLTVEQVAKKEGVQFTHIPFKGSPETEAALLGGHISFSASGFNNAQLEAGETRLLLLFSEERRVAYPQVPILKDSGYYFPSPMFLNVAGPKGMPREIVKKLEDSFTRAMKEPAFIKGMKEIQLPIVYRNSQELTDYVARSYEVFSKLLKDLGLSK
jgi:tripartite-type tricarboxylate transporter receptor subunit TctC